VTATEGANADRTDALVRALVADIAAVADIGDDEDLLGDGLLDSMGVFTLVAGLEDAFRIRITASCLTVENFRSVRTLAGMARRLSSPESPS
jgi:acyl carrier protein